MALDDRYIVASDLEGYFVDKDSGLPLASGTLSFFRDSSRNVPKPVYQLSGSPPNYTYTLLPNPVTLSSVGTPQNALGDNIVIYYYPFDDDGNIDLYYVSCDSSGAVNQFTREAWPPNVSQSINPNDQPFSISNQISNSQFTRTFINEGLPITYNVTGATDQEFSFAPNWFFSISGTGSVTVSVVEISGNTNIVTSPPYLIDVSISGGVTECNLIQRFNTNSGLWASTAGRDIFLSGTLVARNENLGTTGLQMFYRESGGGPITTIMDVSFDNSQYFELRDETDNPVPLSINPDLGKDGYVDVGISFITGSHVRLTSIQLIPSQTSTSPNFFSYEDMSSNREQAFLGDYFIPKLEQKQIESMLTGWDFPLNPSQFGATGNIPTAGLGYIWDQTTAVSLSVSNVSFGRNTTTNGIHFVTSGANNAFYIMQYLEGNQAKKIIGNKLSVNVNAYKSAAGGNVVTRTYLFRAPLASIFPIIPLSIGSVSPSGIFTITQAGWTEIPRSGLDTATANLSVVNSASDINNGNNDYGFSGWELTDDSQILDTDKFAIVQTFSYIDIGTDIFVDSISLIPGDIPCRPATKSNILTLEECQYYYEKNVDPSIDPTAGSTSGLIISSVGPQPGTVSYTVHARFINIKYKSQKRRAVYPTLYAPSGASNSALLNAWDGASLDVNVVILIVGANWTQSFSGTSGASFSPVNRANNIANVATGTSGILALAEASILFNYIVDARIGIVA
jgi:hypothetical protein